ncbi:MAG TPA: hypothetical protein VNT26_15690, partial [Candidatus Sulfotelmatobacter sp.]|nr:hypothetical protein [Candidatus Sulfotelmatobacter sp.]
SDDSSQLWISTDATEANLTMVAEEIGCCKGFLEPGASQTTLTPLHLVAGQKYAIKILLKEGTGDDYVRVAMQSATGTAPAATLQPLISTMVSSMADPAGASLAITQQPASLSTPENVPSVSFSIAANAVTPFGQYTGGGWPTNGLAAAIGTKTPLPTFYQWFTNGVEVPGARGTNLTIAWPKKAMDGMKVKCYAAVPGIPLYSSDATLTVTADTTAPTVVKAAADATFVSVLLKFSEPVSDTALQASRYAIDQGITITSVDRVDLMTVKLNTSRMADTRTYTLTINGVQDTASSPNTIAANTQVQFKSFVYVSGMAIRQKYKGFDNNSAYNINNLFNSPKFPGSPDRTDIVTRMEYPNNGLDREPSEIPWPADASYKLFFDTIEGWFTAPANGNYVFFMALADHGWFYLSTDESPANKHLIMQADGWSDVRAWTTSHDYNPDRSRSDKFSPTEWPNGNTISLQAGKRYYMMLIHHMPDWAGGHWIGATYKMEADPDPALGSAPKLEKSAFGTYLDPTIGSVTFSLQPTNVTTASGKKVTFYAAATGFSAYTTNVTYQ